MQKIILVPVKQYSRIMENYDKELVGLINDLMQMSQEEFDIFLDCIDWKINKKLVKFAIWIYSNRKCTIS